MSLPPFEEPTISDEPSPAITMLNEQGAEGWEALGIMVLSTGGVAVLMKRPVAGA